MAGSLAVAEPRTVAPFDVEYIDETGAARRSRLGHDRRSELWDAIWNLYTHQRMGLADTGSKLFESDVVCLTM